MLQISSKIFRLNSIEAYWNFWPKNPHFSSTTALRMPGGVLPVPHSDTGYDGGGVATLSPGALSRYLHERCDVGYLKLYIYSLSMFIVYTLWCLFRVFFPPEWSTTQISHFQYQFDINLILVLSLDFGPNWNLRLHPRRAHNNWIVGAFVDLCKERSCTQWGKAYQAASSSQNQDIGTGVQASKYQIKWHQYPISSNIIQYHPISNYLHDSGKLWIPMDWRLQTRVFCQPYISVGSSRWVRWLCFFYY